MIEQHVTSLEISERLKELGFERDSLFVHREGMAPRMDRPSGYTEIVWRGPKPQHDDIPAYLASELGEVLPSKALGGELWCNKFPLNAGDPQWSCEYLEEVSYEPSYCHKQMIATTLPDAMGLMLIWLIENGHMEVGGE